MLEELAAISIPELRRRVDTAIAQLRQMRNALAVQAGMRLEDAPTATIPDFDAETGSLALKQMLASLPLLRKPLTPEQRARLHPVSAAQNEQMKVVLDGVIAHKDAYEKLMAAAEEPVPFEKITELRESFDKIEMIAEFKRELLACTEEISALVDFLETRIETGLEAMMPKDGMSN